MKMSLAASIALALLALHLVVGAWDIYATFWLPPGSTVSWVLQGWCRHWPVLPFAMGVLAGHLLWPPYMYLDNGEDRLPPGAVRAAVVERPVDGPTPPR